MKQLSGNEPPGAYRTPKSNIQRIMSDYPQNPKIGDMLRVGDRIGFALRDEDEHLQTWADFGLLELEGPVEATTAITPGVRLYFKDADTPITNNATGGISCGYALGYVEPGKIESIRFLKMAPNQAPW